MSGESGSGSGSGATTVSVVTGLRVETRRLRISAPGRIGDKVCIEDAADCCEPDISTCCPNGLRASVPFAFAAPIGFGGADVVIVGDLIESNNRYSGTFEGEGAELKLALDCRTDVWFANGIITYATGEVKRFTVPLTPEGTDLTADIEIPGRADGALIVENPCVESGGDSGESGSGGGGSPVEGCTACEGVSIPDSLVATLSVSSGLCTAFDGTSTVITRLGDAWAGTITATAPPEFAGEQIALELTCIGGEWQITLDCVGNAAPPVVAAQTSLTCEPFAATFATSTTTPGPCCSGLGAQFTVNVSA